MESNEKNTIIGECHLSKVTIDDIGLLDRKFMSFKIGIKEDAIYKGGMNIFGREFGDHPQVIKLLIEYS